jgi:hypothetical protein
MFVHFLCEKYEKRSYYDARLKVVTEMMIQVAFLWVVKPCTDVLHISGIFMEQAVHVTLLGELHKDHL